MALLVWLDGLFPEWSPLLPYIEDGTARYAEKEGDTQQFQITVYKKKKNYHETYAKKYEYKSTRNAIS